MESTEISLAETANTETMLVLEFSLQLPLLRTTRDAVPEMQLQVERFDATGEGRVTLLFWASGGDFDAFESALADDETVVSPSRIAELEDGYLYHTELVHASRGTNVYPTLAEVGAVIEAVTSTHDGWRFTVGFPDHRAFERFHTVCLTDDVPFTLHRRYERRSVRDRSTFGLTSAQREVLEAALAIGYLEIPRQSSLAELAAYLGISENAASERFRRAAKTLVDSTIGRSPAER